MKLRTLVVLAMALFLLAACASTETTQQAPAALTTIPTVGLPGGTESVLSFALTSTAFEQGGPIPPKYSCDGEDISPPLAWDKPPAETRSLALIMDDPDAPVGTWVHWVVFAIPPELIALPEGMQGSELAVTVGENSWGRSDYGGPCPPSGTHHYFFKLYALDTALNLDKSASKKQVLAAMDGHILAEADLMGTYSH